MYLYLYKLFICTKYILCLIEKNKTVKNCFTTKMHSESLFGSKETHWMKLGTKNPIVGIRMRMFNPSTGEKMVQQKPIFG